MKKLSLHGKEFPDLRLPVYLFFGLLYSLISLVNHYTFKTTAWDLGINNNAIFDYSHFRWNDNTLLPGEQFKNILSDHLSIYPLLIAHFRYIFGTYTMLVFQIAALLFGGMGIYRLVEFNAKSKELALLSLITFFSVWGIYSALSFDYHDNVIASMLVPWLFYSLARNNYRGFFLFGILILLGKENMALWLVFICTGIFILNVQDRKKRTAALGLAAVAAIYFVACIKFIIPAFSNAGRGYLHFNFTALGGNFKEAFFRIIEDPVYAFRLLYINHTGQLDYEGIKAELHKFFFLSGGILLIFRPAYFVMLIPIYAQKLFNDDFAKWGINSHYSIEFAPILMIGAYDVISRKHKDTQVRLSIAGAVLISTAFMTYRSFEHRVSKWYYPDKLTFYKNSHYTAEFDIAEVHRALKLIPPDVPLSASEVLVPHLAFRDSIYQFPVVKNAEFIMILRHSQSYPLNAEELIRESERLLHDKSWLLLYNKNNTLIFRKAPSGHSKSNNSSAD